MSTKQEAVFRMPRRSDASVHTAGLTVLRIAIGWHLLYEGVAKIFQGNWSAADYLASSTWIFGPWFRWIAEAPRALRAVDLINMWALAAIGLFLVLGFVTRAAAFAGAALLLVYYAAHPPFGTGAAVYGGPGSYLIVDRNLVECVALAMIALLPAGALWGLDRLVFKHSAGEDVSLARRDLFANLAGVPVLGALAAAVAGSRTAVPEQAQGQDVVRAGATPRWGGAGLAARPGDIVSVRDYERLAPAKMSVTSYEFVASGAGDDQSVYWNEAAYQRIFLHQKALMDVTRIDTRIRIFGRERPHPIFLSPVSSHGLVHPDGERGTAKGAGMAGATMMVSTFATEKAEDIAKAATRPLWHATYMFKDKAKSLDFIRRAEASGYEAIVVPIDTPVVGARDREHRTYRFRGRKPISFQAYPVNYYRYPTTWADIEWYRAQTKLPLLLKGILDPDDAERGIKLGADGIIVSNHGGRNLDTLPATIDVLPKVVDRVAGRVPVLVDGGIRRGTDVLKALAYGASAVAIGRPFIYGLAVKGPEGVTGVINILRNELEMAMACTGRPTIASIDRSLIAGRRDAPGEV